MTNVAWFVLVRRTAVKSFFSLLICVAAFSLHAATLPGFRIEKLGSSNGAFISSIAVDSAGNIDYTTTAGDVIRFDNGANKVLAHVTTDANSNSGLLGMAL